MKYKGNKYLRKTLIAGFKDEKRKNHKEKMILSKQKMINYYKRKHIPIANFLIVDTTGSNIKESLNEYLDVGFINPTLLCCENNYQMYKHMKYVKTRDSLINAKIRYGDIFKTVLTSKEKINHIQFDGTEAKQTLIKKGLYDNIKNILKSNVLKHISTFEIMYDISQTTKHYKKHQQLILTDFFMMVEKIGRNEGYSVRKIDDDVIKDGKKRAMQYIIFAFERKYKQEE